MMCSDCLGVWRSWRNESAKSTCDCEMLLFEVMWRLMEDWFFASVSRSCLEDRQSLDKSAFSVSVGSFPFAILSKRTSCNNVESLQWNKNIQSISIKAFKEFARPPSLKRLPLFPKGPKWWTLVATAFESIAWYARAKLGTHIFSGWLDVEFVDDVACHLCKACNPTRQHGTLCHNCSSAPWLLRVSWWLVWPSKCTKLGNHDIFQNHSKVNDSRGSRSQISPGRHGDFCSMWHDITDDC